MIEDISPDVGEKRGIISVMKKPREQILRKEVTDLCKLLDEGGLEFLKHQAEILLHNARVEAMRNKALQTPPRAEAEKPAAAVQAAHPAVKETDRGVRIESSDQKFFNIHVGKNRIFFNRDELRSLAKICHASGGVSDGTTRLYRWFERERKDFLNDTGIERAGHPSLAELFEVIVHTYSVKDR